MSFIGLTNALIISKSIVSIISIILSEQLSHDKLNVR